MSMVLSRRHPLQHREPATGFASRLAAVNGVDLYQFLRDMGLERTTLDSGKESTVRTLAQLGGADPSLLIQYSARRTEDEKPWRIGREIFDRRDVFRTQFRYCPHCVLEDLGLFQGPLRARPWLRTQWTIDAVRSCEVHNTLLVFEQPEQRQYYDFCHAIDALRPGLEEQARAAVHVPPSPFVEWIIDRLDQRPETNEFLAQLPMYVVTSYSRALGFALRHPFNVKKRELEDQDLQPLLDVGFGVLQGGKTALVAALQGLHKGIANVGDEYNLIRKLYGDAFAVLQATLEDPNYDGLREIVRTHLLASLPFEKGEQLLGKTVSEPGVYSIKTAKRVSGIHSKTLRRHLVRTGAFEEEELAKLTDGRFFIKAEVVKHFLEGLSESLSPDEVKALTGIPRVDFAAILRGGYLPTVTKSGDMSRTKHRIARSAVDAMLEVMFDGAVSVEVPSKSQLPIAAARKKSLNTFDLIFDLMFSKNLKWKGLLHGCREYGSILLDVDELKAVRLSGSRRRTDGLSSLEMQNFAALTEKSVPRLIVAGLLSVEEDFNPSGNRVVQVVTKVSANEFKTRYISLGEIIARTGLHFKKAIGGLTRLGVATVLDPKEFLLYLYDRTLVEAQWGNLLAQAKN